MSLISELKRRNVFKVGVAYAVVAWVVMQVVDIVLPTFDAPRWVNQTLLFLIILGFPVALVLAWAFELTPDGIKVTKDIDPQVSIRPQTGHKLNYLIVGGLVALLGIVMLDVYVLDGDAETNEVATAPSIDAGVEAADAPMSPAAAANVVEKSLAVLPFANLSDDAEQEYFSDGLTEELINTLSGVDGLLVTGRTSAYAYKDSTLPVREIGALLGVNNVMQGSVRKAGTQLRIAVTLTETASGFNLWTNSWDRELDDIFAVQDEIAEAVATALSVTFGAGNFARSGMTRNVEAYDEYLRSAQLRRTFAMLDAIIHAERAVAIDPAFALGWRGLADAYALAERFLPGDQTVGYAAKRDEADARAVALAPEMPELDLDRVIALRDAGDYLGAEQLLQQYSEEYDLDARFNTEYAYFLFGVGRYDEALRRADRALRLAPASADVANAISRSGANAGSDPDVVRAEVARGIALGGSVPVLNAVLASLEIDEGNLEAALAATGNMVATRDVQSRMLRYVVDGKRDEALAELRTLLADETLVPALRSRHLPVFAALFDDVDLALAFLESGGGMNDIGLDLFSPVRSDPGFKAVVEGKGLLNYWRTSGNWPDYCRPVNDDFECF